MPQQSPAVVQFLSETDAAELGPVDTRNAVVLREPLIEKGVVRGQQINNIAILAHDALEKQFRLSPEVLAQFVVPIGIKLSIG